MSEHSSLEEIISKNYAQKESNGKCQENKYFDV